LLQRAQVEPFPNVNFLGGVQYQASEPRQQGLYQVTMTMPLWNRNQGNIRAAQQSVGTAMAALGRVRNDLSNQTAAALGRYLSAQQSVDRFEQQILPKAQETQRLTQQLYGEGQLDFLRLLQAQRTLIEANLGYINAQEARWTAAAEVAGLLQSERFP
jgi:cobalt-zinc-cadmium efflux system outer membrane protein